VSDENPVRVALPVIAAQWTRIGCIGFGGPPAHIALLRRLCVEQRRWLTAAEFEDGIAATNLLPGPASTQLAIFCAWRIGGPLGGLVGGVCFIVPGLVVVLALSALLLAGHPPRPVLGAAAGAGAAVAAVAVHAAAGLMPASWRRARAKVRWLLYLAAGAVAAALLGPWLVLILIGCGVAEAVIASGGGRLAHGLPVLAAPAGPTWAGPAWAGPAWVGPAWAGPTWAAPVWMAPVWIELAWTALKVGALSYGGGFVIIPLMRADAVDRHHWMSGAEFLDAVALGQVTPGPVVQTVAVVGYAAAGIAGGLLAAVVAFTPSFLFVLAGGRYFDRLRDNATVQAFLAGAGPAAVGAILGAAVPLALALRHLWQVPILVAAAAYLLLLRGKVVVALLVAGGIGAVVAAAGLPVS
jgi:chromate transporter